MQSVDLGDPAPFRGLVRRYRRLAGCSQATLARDSGLNPSVLSRKLNGAGAYLTAPEIKQLIRVLAGRGALGSRAQVLELLAAAGLGAQAITARDWELPPLSRLRGGGERSDADVLAVRALLRQAAVRLVTVVGGTAGDRTRVALEVAESEARCFPGGVVLLRATNGPLLAAVRGALPSCGGALLVLDELVLDGLVPDGAGGLPEVADLLAVDESSKALVTSAHPLRVAGARELHLG